MTRLPINPLRSLTAEVPSFFPAAAPLPSRHRVVGKAAMARHATIAGLAGPLMMGGVVIALIAPLEPSHTTLTILGALPIWAGAAQLLAGWLLRGRNLVQIAAFLWIAGGLCVLPYFAVPTVAEYWGNTAAIGLVLVSAACFFVIRALGMAAMPSIVHPLGCPQTFGRVQADINRWVWLSALVATGVAFVVLTYGSLGMNGNVMLLLGIGVCLNTASGLFVRQVPLQSNIQQYSVLAGIVEMWHRITTKALRPTLFLCALNAIQWLSMGMIGNYAVKMRGWGGEMLLLMGLVCCAAMFASNHITRQCLDRWGSRRGLAIGAAVLFTCAMMMALGIDYMHNAVLFIVGAVAHGAVWLIGNATGRLVMREAPDGPDKVVYMSSMSVAATLVCVTVGLGMGALCDMMDAAERMAGSAVVPGLSTYSPVFFALALVTLLGFAVVRRHPSSD